MHIIAFNSWLYGLWLFRCERFVYYTYMYCVGERERAREKVVNSTNIVSVLLKMSLWTFTMNPCRLSGVYATKSVSCVYLCAMPFVIVLCEMPIWLTSRTLNVWRSHLCAESTFHHYIFTMHRLCVCRRDELNRNEIRVHTYTKDRYTKTSSATWLIEETYSFVD